MCWLHVAGGMCIVWALGQSSQVKSERTLEQPDPGGSERLISGGVLGGAR